MYTNSRILIVDDNIINLKVVAATLQEKNYSLAFAQDGDEVFEVLERFKPDLILLDIMMPKVNGYTVCKQLKQKDEIRDIPVIFLTAKSEEEDISKAFEVGGVDYITKPFFKEELLARISTHLKLKKSHDLILQQHKELDEANKAKDQLFSVISHDMRTPLASMQMLLSHLIGSGDLSNPEFLIASLKHMQVSANDTYQMLDNLLAWSRNQLRSLKCMRVYFDLKQTVGKCIAQQRNSAEKKGVEINFNVGEEFTVYADEEMINSVIRNLLQNAIKFSYPNSEIHIGVEKQGSKAVFSIRDFGVGIEAGQQSKLFNSSYYSTLGTNGERGTGLGLGLCKTFLEMNQGEINMHSVVGNGSTFSFTVPLRKADTKL